ncbi:MAG: PD-(D/E)XK nuclease domain-containing protein, partial [Bacteroidota bacterium]
TPTFLLNLLKREFQYDLQQVQVGSTAFESYTLEQMNWQSLMFQTGYLTVQNYQAELDLYTLGYPNREVKSAMFQHLLAEYRTQNPTESQPLYANLKLALDGGELERAVQLIDAIFAGIPHQLFDAKRERFFHAVLHLTFQGLGLLTESEVSTAKGRVDTVVHSKSGVYVMEFKLDASAQEALQQIRQQRYGSTYLGGNQPVIALGISFSSERRAVAEWEAMPYEQLLAEG